MQIAFSNADTAALINSYISQWSLLRTCLHLNIHFRVKAAMRLRVI